MENIRLRVSDFLKCALYSTWLMDCWEIIEKLTSISCWFGDPVIRIAGCIRSDSEMTREDAKCSHFPFYLINGSNLSILRMMNELKVEIEKCSLCEIFLKFHWYLITVHIIYPCRLTCNFRELIWFYSQCPIFNLAYKPIIRMMFSGYYLLTCSIFS